MDFEGARRNADERLNQELIRIRNLPKRSKIKIVNKYGLKHASHTNAGLLKELEINLDGISREQRRVANECNKRQKDFKEVQRKSLSKFLPTLEQEEEVDEKLSTIKKKPQRPKRSTAVFDQTPVWLKGRRESISEKRREIILDMTTKSKKRTFQIISENNKKTSIGVPLPPLREPEFNEDTWVTRLHRPRKNAFAGSCFPFLLAEDKEYMYNKDQGKNRGQKLHHNPQLPQPLPNKDIANLKERTFRGTVYEKVLKMPDPAKIPHLNPRDPKLYQVVMKVRKRKVSKLENSDAVVARKNTVFTRHWK